MISIIQCMNQIHESNHIDIYELDHTLDVERQESPCGDAIMDTSLTNP